MKTAAASVISASASAPPIWNRSRKTSEVLRKLSLNAAKNWVQNRGAKRRVISRDEDMAFPLVPMGAGPACATNAGSVCSLAPQAKHGGKRDGVRGSWRGTPLCPLPVVSAFTRVFNALWRGEGTCRADGLWAALTGLRDDNLGKRTIARRGSVKRRHWRDANDDHAQNKGGRPGAARRSGPATFDFATGAGAACRAPSGWLRRSGKRRPHTRAYRARSTWRPSFCCRLRLNRLLSAQSTPKRYIRSGNFDF